MGERGFEPLKAYASRFTVCPLWPLGYSPLSEAWYLPPEGRARNVGFGLKAAGRTRTADLKITNHVLFQLSYGGWAGMQGTLWGCRGQFGLCSRWPGPFEANVDLAGAIRARLAFGNPKYGFIRPRHAAGSGVACANRCSPVDPHESCLQNQEGGNPSTCEVLGRRSTLNTAAWRLHPRGGWKERERNTHPKSEWIHVEFRNHCVHSNRPASAGW